MVETTTGRQGFAGDEEAVAEGFREVVEGVARDTEKLGRVRGKLPGVKGVNLVGRGAQEPEIDRSSNAEGPRSISSTGALLGCWGG